MSSPFFFISSSLSLSISMKVTLCLSSSILHQQQQQQHFSPHLCYMGDLGTEDVQFQLLGESVEEGEHMNMGMGGMGLHFPHGQDNHGVEVVEFWPLEHPMEPLDEDRPIKCPMDESSVINDGLIRKEQHGESSWKRRTHHHSSPSSRGVRGRRGTVVAETIPDAQPPRALRKRQHTLTAPATGDHILSPLQHQDFTIFQMLRQPDKFDQP